MRVILIIILVLILYVKVPTQEVIVNNTVEPLEVVYYDYEIGNVKLLHKETGEIEEMTLDEYIVNVLAGEMPVDYELEALKAQAIVARTYTLYKINHNKKHENADICDDSTCCQAWCSKEKAYSIWKKKKEERWNKLITAVNETAGKYITYEGKVINAFFHCNSSGKTEKAEDVWGGSLPYLDVVEVFGEDTYETYKSSEIIPKEAFEKIMKDKYNDYKSGEIKILEYTDSGRVKKLKIGNKIISGVDARKLFGLRSTNFIVVDNKSNVIFEVLGYGHGVGLSQTGSNTMAKNGVKAEDIIKHFYKNIEIHE